MTYEYKVTKQTIPTDGSGEVEVPEGFELKEIRAESKTLICLWLRQKPRPPVPDAYSRMKKSARR